VIIAVDGPAASGKGTIARALAAHYALPCLDTGMLYRAVGIAVIRSGGRPDCATDALSACDFDHSLLADPDLRSEAASNAASIVSVHPPVRAALLQRQRDFASQAGGAVLDGRDIGSVIVPHADAKLFVTAAAAIRAERRFAELSAGDGSVSYQQILDDIERRDARDSGRSAAPLRQADDADLLDTGYLSIDESIRQAISLVEARINP
jgi:CMP/dCMP kinase